MADFSLNLLPSDTTMDPPNHKSSFTFFSHPDESSETTTSTYAAANATDHMFEKSLTPSDVGKLNRLVIPKQHAEKYFPPAAATTAGGILLAFQDECGKCWRFRYSYWNSSQSYVLTKGWSRYVKDKKLDAGDVVLFERHRFEPDRFFIGWRRRGTAPQPPPNQRTTSSLYNAVQLGYPAPQEHRITAASFQYLPSDCFHAGTEGRPQQIMSQKPASVNPKRLRLFGVNLDCQLEVDEDTEPQTSDGSSLSSQGTGSGPYSVSGSGAMSYNYFDYMGYPPNHHNHMDMNYPQDVNQMRN